MGRGTIIAQFHPYVDGQTICSGTSVYVLPQAGNYAIRVTITEHRHTVRVLEWNLHTNPLCDPGTPTNVRISANVIGCTLIGVGSGTTLTCEAIAVGF